MRKIISKYEPFVGGQLDIEKKLKDEFSSLAYLYLVMDDEVCLGTYKKEAMRIRRANGELLSSITWEYVQELAVFNEKREFRARSYPGGFRGRLRSDDEGGEAMVAEDETQKLWGSVKEVCDGWNLLRSQRGSRFWVPDAFAGQVKERDSIAIQVRKYLCFPDATKKQGLIRQEDERFFGFCLWQEESGSEGKEDLK